MTHSSRGFRALSAAAGGGLIAVLLVGAPAHAAPTEPVNSAACRSLPAPAADVLRATDAHALFGVDGTGVRVGIISGSFGTKSNPSAADDVAAGLLPGPGNPCGHLVPVQVLTEAPAKDNDEGRAMAQVVHGIAPGAELVFTANPSDTNAGMAEAIRQLRAANVDVIVDDVTLRDDLALHRGAAGRAVQEAVDAGVSYFSAAGNYSEIGAPGYPSEGFPISGWQTSSYRASECPADVTAAAQAQQDTPTAVDCLDFDPSAGVDPSMTVTIPAGNGVPAYLTWGEPVDAVATRIGFAIKDVATGQVIVGWALDPNVPFINGGFSAIGSTTAVQKDISFVRQLDPAAGTPAIALSVESDNSADAIADLEYFRSTDTDAVGVTIKGHQAEPANMAVAAVNVDTLALETFSSAGPATTYIGFPSQVTIEGPALSGVDHLPISFSLAPDGSGPTNFTGTSAAAPSVAAAAALLYQASPDASPQQIRDALTSTARADAFTSPWSPDLPRERFSGAGLVDAAAAVAMLTPPAPPTPTPTDTPTVAPTDTPTAVPTNTPSTAPTNTSTLANSGSDPAFLAAAFAAGSIAVGITMLTIRRRRLH